MHQIGLNATLVAQLATMPEQGMGYHRVDLQLRDGSRLRSVTVIQGCFAEVPEHVQETDVVSLEKPPDT